MEDIRGLKDVLERVEGKLVVVRYVHVALAFVYWATVLAIFYLILDIVKRIGEPTAIAFWLSAVMLYYPIWSRTKKILGLNFRAFAFKIVIPLLLVIVLNFWIVSSLMTFMSPDRATSVGLLCSISMYLLIVALIVKARRGRFPKEMLPAILSFAFIPMIFSVDDPLVFIGYVIMTTYGISALICLIRAISVVEDEG